MALKYGILGLLNYSPMTGYKLKKTFDRSINNVWTASLSQIYRELNALETEGFVSSQIQEQEDRPDKRIYSITKEGITAFNEWVKEPVSVFLSPKRDEFMLKLFFGNSLGGPGVKEMLRQFVGDREKALQGLCKDESNLPELINYAFAATGEKPLQDDQYLKFILKRAKRSNELLIAWAKECIADLEEMNGGGDNK